MKRAIWFLFVSLFVMSAALEAQTPRIVHRLSPWTQASNRGHDYWFAIPATEMNQGGQYINFYISSPTNTTAFVAINGATEKPVPIIANKTATFNAPLSWIMVTSGIAEGKAIHVWSNDADLNCSVMCYNSASSDGFDAIPVSGWGTDYAVAAAPAGSVGSGTQVYDFPSQFIVVAAYDSTIVTVTPSVDLRQGTGTGSDCHAIAFPHNVPFSQMLMRGQAIQYQATCATDSTFPDVTGSIVHSNKPIGLIGGSMLTLIPLDFAYGDYVCEMIPPIRNWAQQYYSLPYALPPGQTSFHSANTFLVITSQDSQVVHRTDSLGDHIFLQGVHRFDQQIDHTIATASNWTSDAPFLLVQYINSSDYPDQNNGEGDPSMAVVEPLSSYSDTVIFQNVLAIDNQTPYANYANVIAPRAAKVLIDGSSIAGKFASIPIDNNYVGYQAKLSTGSHVVTSNLPVSVTVYGYDYDDAYSWPVVMAAAEYPLDTIEPTATITGNCLTAHVMATDLGAPFELVTIDTTYNMTYHLDTAHATYDMTVINELTPALMRVTFYDTAKNGIHIESQYAPAISMPDTLLQLVAHDTAKIYEYDTIVNKSTALDTVVLSLASGTRGFTVDSASPAPLTPGERRPIRITFTPSVPGTFRDTLIARDPCISVSGWLAALAVFTKSAVAEMDDRAQPAVVLAGQSLLVSGISTPSSVELDNLLGSLVLRANVQPNAAIDISALAAGVYFYRLTAPDGVRTGKIVIP